MRKRTKARECALQMLYQLDIRHVKPPEIVEQFWQEDASSQDVRSFADRLVTGTIDHLPEIDQLITKHASNWDLSRMAVIDRNILRLGVYELLHVEEVPPKVCINEAVELAKRFGDTDSSKFINGILDAIHKAHERDTPSAADPTAV